MGHQKIQNCGTACCDCTVACKYDIVEDLYAQDAESFAHFIEVNNDYNLLIVFMFAEVETAMMQKFAEYPKH
jgi:hypothetical protein